jgi:hypothetical protein
MKRLSVYLFVLLIVAASSVYGGSLGGVTITVEDHSFFPGTLQVRDENCKFSKLDICNAALDTFKSAECRDDPGTEKCEQAHDDVLQICPCKEAERKLRSVDCGRDLFLPECVTARKVLEGASCIDGLIFEGQAGKSIKQMLTVCKSSGGFGSVAVRDRNKGMQWTIYTLLSDGAVIVFP